MQVIEIQTRQGDIIILAQNMGEEAVQVFIEQFKETQVIVNYEIFGCIKKSISKDQNDRMERMLDK